MTKYRLKENHPAFKAMEELAKKAKELGISIDYFGQRIIICFQGISYTLEANDLSKIISEFPPTLGYKLTYNNKKKVLNE